MISNSVIRRAAWPCGSDQALKVISPGSRSRQPGRFDRQPVDQERDPCAAAASANCTGLICPATQAKAAYATSGKTAAITNGPVKDPYVSTSFPVTYVKMIAPMPPPNAVIPYTVPTKRGATMSPGMVCVVVAQPPCPSVGRLTEGTTPSRVGATIAGRLAAIETALISMTTFRARSSVHPCFMRRDDIQPPPTFPTSRVTNGIINSKPMLISDTSR